MASGSRRFVHPRKRQSRAPQLAAPRVEVPPSASPWFFKMRTSPPSEAGHSRWRAMGLSELMGTSLPGHRQPLSQLSTAAPPPLPVGRGLSWCLCRTCPIRPPLAHGPLLGWQEAPAPCHVRPRSHAPWSQWRSPGIPCLLRPCQVPGVEQEPLVILELSGLTWPHHGTFPLFHDATPSSKWQTALGRCCQP